ncbi:prephenate dehydrogenase [Hutsoniella sourekii]
MDQINIAIVGLGVVGGSFALALAQQDTYPVNVMGIDHNLVTLQKAQQANVISRGEVNNQTILQEADLVIITLYPFDLVDFIKANKDYFKPGAIVTDVTGVKGDLIHQVLEYLPESLEFIPGHPMAGKEKKGFDYASAEVFKGANYLLMPHEKSTEENLNRFISLLQVLGFKRISQVSSSLHDEMIAYTSQLCHVISVALVNSDNPERETVKFIGDSYRELTRIAKINDELWTQLFVTNKEQLLKSIEYFEVELDYIKDALVADKFDNLRQAFQQSTQRRENLEINDLKTKE